MAEQAETWTPPLNFEEKLKKYLLPPQIYIKRLHAKELRRGEKEIGLVPFCVTRKSPALISARIKAFTPMRCCRTVLTFMLSSPIRKCSIF